MWNLKNKINKIEQTHRNRGETDSYQMKGGVGGLGEKGEGNKQKTTTTTKKTPQRHIQQYGDYQKKKGAGEVEEGKEGINGDRRRLDLEW